jgi:hypothetical protein
VFSRWFVAAATAAAGIFVVAHKEDCSGRGRMSSARRNAASGSPFYPQNSNNSTRVALDTIYRGCIDDISLTGRIVTS